MVSENAVVTAYYLRPSACIGWTLGIYAGLVSLGTVETPSHQSVETCMIV